MFTLLRGANLFAPEEMGSKDVLFCGGRIISVAEHITESVGDSWGPIEVVDLTGQLLVPGFIDQHLHLVGGSGWEGPSSRIPEIMLSSITRWGITTVVGCMGIDCQLKPLEMLLGKALSLEAEGISAYILSGGFRFPPHTLMRDLRGDLMLIEKVLGVKLAMGETAGGHPTALELARVASDVVAGAAVGGKVGNIQVHIGLHYMANPFSIIREAMEISGVPPQHFIITHVNWSAQTLRGACEFASVGTYLNIDGILSMNRGVASAVEPEEAVLQLWEAGVPWERLTLTTDGNGSTPRLDPGTGKRKPYRLGTETLLRTIQKLVEGGKVSLTQALQLVTSTPAKVLGISNRKGSIHAGGDADLVVLTKNLALDRVYSRGQLMVAEKRPVVYSMFEFGEQLNARGEFVSNSA